MHAILIEVIMYPLYVFNLFPPFPRDNKVFVAMNFRPDFDNRWKVIEKAINSIQYNGELLEAYRVDKGKKANDSILTEILTGIGNCRLFFADITAVGDFKGEPIRTNNVMYELGIAQATRLPEELILFRSDEKELPFDIEHNRVHKYYPDNKPEEAREKVINAIEYAFTEIKNQKHMAVSRAAESLDYYSELVLSAAASEQAEGVLKPELKLWSGGTWFSNIWNSIFSENRLLSDPLIVNSISRLLELGILSTQYANFFGEGKFEGFMSYKITPFGQEVHNEIRNRKMNIRERLKKKSKV